MWGKGERQTFSLKIKPKKNRVCFRWIVTWIHLLCILYEKERTSSPYSVDSTWFLYEHCVFEWFCAKNCARGIVGKTSRTTTTTKKKVKKINRKGNNWDSCLCMSQTILFWIQRGCFQNNFRYFLLVCYIFNCLTSNNLITICRGILWYKNHYRNLFTDGNQKLQKKN